MTAKERNFIQTTINKLTELDAEKDRLFKQLQALNVECGDGRKWCSVDANLEGARKHGDENQRNRALWMYRRYFEADAKEDLLREFGQGLADLGFWKH